MQLFQELTGKHRSLILIALAVTVTLALLPSAWLAWSGRDLPHLGRLHDDGLYMTSAQGLAEGKPYVIESLPWRPAQTKYPPLFAAYLSLAWLAQPTLEGAAPIAMALAWIWLPVWMAGSYLLFRRQGFTLLAVVPLLVLIALHPYSLMSATRLMTDLMFSALATWALVFLDDPGRAAVAERRRAGLDLPLGLLLLALAYLTRTAALPLMAACCACFAWKRQWRQLAWLASGCAVVALGWMLWVSSHKAVSADVVRQYYTDYFAYQLRMIPLAALPAHVAGQFDHFIDAATAVLLVNFGDFAGSVFLKRVLFVGAVSGVVRLMRQGRFVGYGWFALFYSAMLLVWYAPPEPRFLLPLLPLLATGFAGEVGRLGSMIWRTWQDQRPQSRGNRAVALAMGLALASLPFGMISTARALFALTGPEVLQAERDQQIPMESAYSWIAANTAPGETFFTVDDPVFYLHTHRRALRSPVMETIFRTEANGALVPTDETIAVMDRFHLGCLFLSAKHFGRLPSEGAMKLVLSLEGTPLRQRYRTETEVVACRENLVARQ